MLKNIFRGWALALALLASAQAQTVGAGSSLANPLMQSLVKTYSAAPRAEVSYRSVGSGEGIRRLVANAIDFSLSDVPLNAYEQSAMGLVQWPLFFSGITPVVNLPGFPVSELRLSGSVLAAIFQGRIRVWNDPQLQALNPQRVLPAMPIQVIHRSDSSGTTFAFTSYLAKVSPPWADALGVGSRLNWPMGQGVTGGEGVAQAVAKTPGSLSYLEFSAAEKQGLSMPQLLTQDEVFVSPGPATFRATLDQANWQRPGFYQPFLMTPLAAAWPLVTATFVLVPLHPEDRASARQTLAFLRWAQAQTALIEDKHLLAIQNPELLDKVNRQLKTLEDQLSKEPKK